MRGVVAELMVAECISQGIIVCKETIWLCLWGDSQHHGCKEKAQWSWRTWQEFHHQRNLKMMKIFSEEQETQEEKKGSKVEDVDTKLPWNGTLEQCLMLREIYQRILQEQTTQGPEIMTFWLQEMYVWLRLSPKEAKILVKEHGFSQISCRSSLTRMSMTNIMRKPGSQNADGSHNK